MARETVCRSCGATEFLPILSLGEMPLANALRAKDQLASPEARFPLDLVLCPACSLVQITETVPPQQLFGDYPYFSSFSDTMVSHADELVRRQVRERGLNDSSLAVEIASNDGYLLQFYAQAEVPVLGIEPAANVARVATERGVRTVCEFFDASVADRLVAEYGRADVVHANNVLAHVADLNGVVEGFRRIVKENGVVIVEVPYVRDMIDRVEFDTIYHEHLCYFSLTALATLFSRHGLTIHDVERLDIHGGSLRIFASPHTSVPERARSVPALLEEEEKMGVSGPEFYRDFADRVARLKEDLVTLIAKLRESGKRIAAYGASAKGTTLLNYFGIGAGDLEFVVDRSTVKQGRYTPGMHLPILPPEMLLKERPDYVLLLTWNFAGEILQQQETYREGGGKFIVPIPELTVV
jgi:SAM-dependent methyltransferase